MAVALDVDFLGVLVLPVPPNAFNKWLRENSVSSGCSSVPTCWVCGPEYRAVVWSFPSLFRCPESGMAKRQGQLRGCVTCAATHGPMLRKPPPPPGSTFYSHQLEILHNF